MDRQGRRHRALLRVISSSPAGWPSLRLRRVLDELAPRAGFQAEVAVLPISVAALMTPQWVARHLEVPEGVEKVILPGILPGRPGSGRRAIAGRARRVGPEDLRDLPATSARPAASRPATAPMTSRSSPRSTMRPRLERDELIRQAEQFRVEGADVIDLGCDPGTTWTGSATP